MKSHHRIEWKIHGRVRGTNRRSSIKRDQRESNGKKRSGKNSGRRKNEKEERKTKGKRGNNGKKKQTVAAQLWSISIFNVDDSFCPRNWKFGLRPPPPSTPLCRASFDRRGLISPEIRGAALRAWSTLSFPPSCAKGRGGKSGSLAGHAMTSDRKVRNRLRGRRWPERKKKVSWEMAVRWKRSVFIEPLLIYFALFVSWFFRFFFFFFFFERYIWRMNFWLEYEFKGLKCDPTSLHKFLHKEIVFIWKR